MVTTPGELLSGKTAWARRVQSPPREFLRTESGGAAVLLAAAVAALVWVNVDASSYIEVFFNRRRRHSTLGFLSPAQFETIIPTKIEKITTTAAAVA